jgi:FkbM family methyltransferase
VQKLFAMIKRNTTRNFDFYCLTDNPGDYNTPVIPIELEKGYEGWWNKMQLFKPGILPRGEYLYFDLDVVIVDDIDCFFDFDNFGITRDFIRPDNGLLGGKEYNSSIMRFTQNEQLWNFFVENDSIWQKNQQKVQFFGDQNVISAHLNSKNYNTPFPDEWIWSFKVGNIRGRKPFESGHFPKDYAKYPGAKKPEHGKVCIFHGEPSPSEVTIDWVSDNHCIDNFSSEPEVEREISVAKMPTYTELSINHNQFKVPHHWFWDQFSKEWEPQTYDFFKKNLIAGTGFLDIGGWVGPTALIATAIGAGSVKIVEPNPVNFFHLLSTQFNNQLLSKWFMINACVSNTGGSTIIGPLQGISSGSSATNIRDPKQDGAQVISLKLSDLISEDDNFSLIKIDIEGAEELIINDLKLLSDQNSAIWLSIHPPFFEDEKLFLKNLLTLGQSFFFVDSQNVSVSADTISERTLSQEKNPEWGTKWGNFFEIGLLPKRFYSEKREFILRKTGSVMKSMPTAA